MLVDSSLAKELSQRHLEAWLAEGQFIDREVPCFARQTHFEVRSGRPPAEAIHKMVAGLRAVLQRPSTFGDLDDLGNSEYALSLYYPEVHGDGLGLIHLSGSLNGRTGGVGLKRRRLFEIGSNTRGRLHERLESGDAKSVLNEVFSVVYLGATMLAAAIKANAHSWPLISANGIFVGRLAREGDATFLVTWMRDDQLGTRWGRISDDFRSAAAADPCLLEDPDFCAQLLRLHTWPLRAHRPGPAVVDEWGEQAPSAAAPSVVTDDGLAQAKTSTGYEELPAKSDVRPREALDFVPGLNYSEVAPPFSPLTQFTGRVVQKRSGGSLVVSLENGWFGLLPWTYLKTVRNLEHSDQLVQIGASVSVEVVKIQKIDGNRAYVVFLNLSAGAERAWKLVEERFPVGTSAQGIVRNAHENGLVVELENGPRAFLANRELSWFGDVVQIRASLTVGTSVRVKVIDTKPHKRRLLLSLRECRPRPVEDESLRVGVGDSFHGCVVNVVDYGVFVKLPSGLVGLVHKTCLQIGTVPKAGDIIDVIVLSIHHEGRLSLGQLEAGQLVNEAGPSSSANSSDWSLCEQKYPKGSVCNGTIAGLFCGGAVVRIAAGAYGLVWDKELTWFADAKPAKVGLRIGDPARVKVLEHKAENRQMMVSIRQCALHPFDDEVLRPKLLDVLDGLVISTVDYGVFVRLAVGVEGLLHTTQIPDGVSVLKGQSVRVQITQIDVAKRRFGFRYVSHMQTSP